MSLAVYEHREEDVVMYALTHVCKAHAHLKVVSLLVLSTALKRCSNNKTLYGATNVQVPHEKII